MRFSDIVALAGDNLSRARLRTALTALGVAIGTAAVVTLISVGSGAESFAINRAASFGQLTTVLVQPSTASTKRTNSQFHAITPATVAAVGRIPHVDGVYAALSLPLLRLTLGSRSLQTTAAAQTPITAQITLRTALAPLGDGVLLPDDMARRLGPSGYPPLGSRITVTAGGGVCCADPANDPIEVLGPDRTFTARVAGIYTAASWSRPGSLRGVGDAAPVLLSPALGARIDGALRGQSPAGFLAHQGYDFAYVHVDDARQTAGVAARVRGMSYQVYDRADLLTQVHVVFSVLTAGLGAIGGIALLVAAVGIANTMIMTILERTREIGIMKALGAEPGVVRRLFLVETALVGLVGGAAGLALAAVASVAGNAVFRVWLRGQGVTDNIGRISDLSPSLVVGAVILAVVVSLLAGAWPSRRAMRLQPLDALRYE